MDAVRSRVVDRHKEPAAPLPDSVQVRGPRQRLVLLLCGPTAVAVYLAFSRLGRLPLWRDEVATVVVAHRSLGGTLRVLWNREANMGLYYLFMNGWVRFGVGETWVRVPSALFAVATVPVTMLLARRISGDRLALVAGTFTALNGFLLTYAQEARSYSLVALLAVTSSLLLVRAFDASSRGRWIGYVVASTAMIYAHMLAAVVLAAQLASVSLLKPERAARRQFTRSLLVVAVLASPIGTYALLADTGQTSWIPRPHLAVLSVVFHRYAGSDALARMCALLLAVAMFEAIRVAVVEGRSRRLWTQVFPLVWFALPALAVFVVSLRKPLFVDRYLIAVVPALLVSVALGVVALRRTVLIAAVTVAFALLSFRFVTNDVAHRQMKSEDLRAAARLVLTTERPGDGLIYAPGFARVGFAYYLDRLSRPGQQPADLDARPGRSSVQVGDLFTEEDTPQAVAQRVMHRRRLWLVGYPGNIWHPTPEPVLTLQHSVLSVEFRSVRRWHFGQLTVSLLERQVSQRPRPVRAAAPTPSP